MTMSALSAAWPSLEAVLQCHAGACQVHRAGSLLAGLLTRQVATVAATATSQQLQADAAAIRPPRQEGSAEALPSTSQPDSSGGSGRRGGRRRGRAGMVLGGCQVTTTAPWPFIDPSRPMILPEYVSPTNTRPPTPSLPLEAALRQVKENAAARIRGTERDALSGRPRCRATFDETLEFIANLSVNPRKADQLVRGVVQLPYGTGKSVTICVFAQGAQAEVARQAGADLIGDEALIQTIIDTGGKSLGFDKLIATPEFVKPLARAGKVLGPKGLMPNVKLGTLTEDVAAALQDMRRGRLDFRVDRDGVMHAPLGKLSFPNEQLQQNIGAFIAALLELRPASLPGEGVQGYVKSIFVKSSMTASIPVTLQSCEVIAAAAQAAKAAAKATADGADKGGSAAS